MEKMKYISFFFKYILFFFGTMALRVHDEIIRYVCSKVGGKLRVRIITPGYNPLANCQFPRAIREDGKEYTSPRSALSFSSGPSGKFFYRVKGKFVTIVGGTHPQTIFESEECVICLDLPPSIVFCPCGHYVCCEDCSSQLLKSKGSCPICRSVIKNHVTKDQLQT